MKYVKCMRKIDSKEILHIQNKCCNEQSFVFVLNTCIFFITDYNFSLICSDENQVFI